MSPVFIISNFRFSSRGSDDFRENEVECCSLDALPTEIVREVLAISIITPYLRNLKKKIGLFPMNSAPTQLIIIFNNFPMLPKKQFPI